jgi:hypothetical protein
LFKNESWKYNKCNNMYTVFVLNRGDLKLKIADILAAILNYEKLYIQKI